MHSAVSIERWAPVAGYGGFYEVSDLGRVRSYRRGAARVLRPGRQSSGHMSVVLGRGSTRTVHTLVMEAFVGPAPKGQEVRHLDGDPSNNRLGNLAYGSRSQNLRDNKWQGKPRKLAIEDVRAIKFRLSTGERGLGRLFGVSRATIAAIKSGRTHNDV